MNPKVKSFLAHLTPMAWVLALVLNSIKRDPLTSFYLRQTFGLYLCFLLSWFIPEYNIIAWGFFFVFWVYSFVGVVKGIESPVPFVGTYFQKWFKIIT